MLAGLPLSVYGDAVHDALTRARVLHARVTCAEDLRRARAGQTWDLVLVSWCLPGLGPQPLGLGAQRVVCVGQVRSRDGEHVIERLPAGTPPYRVATTVRALAEARTVHWGGFCVDLSCRRVWWHGAEAGVTGNQVDLLYALARAAGAVLSADCLARALGSPTPVDERRRIGKRVERMRQTLSSVDPEAGAAIETVRGAGFRLRR